MLGSKVLLGIGGMMVRRRLRIREGVLGVEVREEVSSLNFQNRGYYLNGY